MDAFERGMRCLSNIGGALAAAFVIAITALGILEIVLRSLFNTSTYLQEEFTGYGLALIAFLGLGRTFVDGAIIRVNLLRDRFPRRLLVTLEILLIAVTIVLMLFIAYNFSVSALKYFQRGTVGETMAQFPAWILPALIATGCVTFALQMAAYMSSVVRTGELIRDHAEDSPV